MVLVTGATGLLGSHLVFRLVSNNEKVRAVYRRAEKLELVKRVFGYYSDTPETLFEKVEWVEANLNDLPQLEKVFKDIDYVYHCAAFVSFEPDKFQQLRKINIEGTANIVNLCIANNVKKLCYSSSVAALGKNLDPDKPITEETEWNPANDHSVYAITKYGAELEVWRGSQEGLDVVIVNPGVIIGPGFWRSGGSSSLIRKVALGMSYYTEGSTGYVDIDDVVEIMVRLVESEIKTERFILVSENLQFKNFIEQTANALGVPPPETKAGPWTLAIAWRLDWLRSKVMGKRRRISKQLAKSLQTKTLFSNEKIKSVLGYDFIPISHSIEKTVKYYQADYPDSVDIA
ncbi:MAG: NAD-dependent epimerase/dehydratase family protein [Flavobacteriaceae bacterium]|nr:NAD-dependent epimerase/dehydratase family protein [Flavobacteriaceae bacterium]